MDGWGFKIDKVATSLLPPRPFLTGKWDPLLSSSLKRPIWIHPKTTFLYFILTGPWLLGPSATFVQRPQASPVSFQVSSHIYSCCGVGSKCLSSEITL